jgi:hypothetical protein
VVASGRRRYCSGACRQAAWRQRHQLPAGPVTQPSPPSHSASVYECPACEVRYLGSQRCDDCNQFCRRIGPGALCPHCDEPVTLADLIPTISTSSKEANQRP